MKEEKSQLIPPVFLFNALQSFQTGILNFANHLSPPFVQVLILAAGAWNTQIVYAAAKLGIADMLENGPKSADDLAKETESNPDAIYRLLRTLASVGIFKESSDRVFELTPAAKTLQKNHPMSVQPLALLVGDSIWREPWGNIMHSIKTGEEAFENIFKKGFFEYLNEHKDKSEIFNNWMSRVSNMNCPVIADNGKILVVDAVIKPGNSRDVNKFIDLQMLLINKGGRERTEQEFRKLFQNADLELLKIIPTASMFSIVEGGKN
jgi:hypothetical protein